MKVSDWLSPFNPLLIYRKSSRSEDLDAFHSEYIVIGESFLVMKETSISIGSDRVNSRKSETSLARGYRVNQSFIEDVRGFLEEERGTKTSLYKSTTDRASLGGFHHELYSCDYDVAIEAGSEFSEYWNRLWQAISPIMLLDPEEDYEDFPRLDAARWAAGFEIEDCLAGWKTVLPKAS